MKTEVLEVGSSNGNKNDRMLVIVDFILEVDVADDWLAVVIFDCIPEVIEVCFGLLYCRASRCRADEDC
jgi:hypothetical protein